MSDDYWVDVTHFKYVPEYHRITEEIWPKDISTDERTMAKCGDEVPVENMSRMASMKHVDEERICEDCLSDRILSPDEECKADEITELC